MELNTNRCLKKAAQPILFVCLGLLFGFIILFYFLFSFFKESDIERYRMLVESASTAKKDFLSLPYSAKQHRTNTQKDIFFNENNERLRMKLSCDDSVLVLDHHGETTEIIEHMKNVKCYMQEELYYLLPDGREAKRQPNGRFLIKREDPAKESSWISENTHGIKPMQIIRYFESDTGAFYYKTDRFVADNVKVTRFSTPGHILEDLSSNKKLLMSGNADSVEFSLLGKELNFKAYRLKAKLYTLEKAS